MNKRVAYQRILTTKISKGILGFLFQIALLSSAVTASAVEMVVGDWWPNDGTLKHTISPVNDCNTVFKVVMSTTYNGQCAMGIGYIDSKGSEVWLEENDLVGLSSVSGLSYTCENNDCSFKFKDESLTFYVSFDEEAKAANNGKYTISSTQPSWGMSAAVTQPASGQLVDLGDKINLRANYCAPSGVALSDVTYKWFCADSSDAIDSDWIEIEGETGASIEFPAVYDKRSVKCEIAYSDGGNDKSIVTPPHYISNINIPSLSLSVGGDAVKINESEIECDRFKKAVFAIGNKNLVVKSATIEGKGFSDTKFKPVDDKDIEFSEKDNAWAVTSLESMEYKIIAIVGLPVYGGGTKDVELKQNVAIRTVFVPDEGAEKKVLFYDDFGYFKTGEYYYGEENEKSVSIADSVYYGENYFMNQVWDNEADDGNGGKGKMVDFKDDSHSNLKLNWVGDLNGFVQGHKFAMQDPYISDVFVKHTYNASKDCGSNNYKQYICWEGVNGFRVEDEYYAILSNPQFADGMNTQPDKQDYWSGKDHSDNDGGDGAMLFVNCAASSMDKVIYRREFKLNDPNCTNVMVLFSTFVSNASIKSGNKSVNVRIDIKRIETDGSETLIGQVASGDIVRRNPGVDNSLWSHLSTSFPLTDPNKVYVMEITNNMPGGSANAGNDILLDDISVTVCYPNIELLAKDENGKELKVENDTLVICGEDATVVLEAFNKVGIEKYIPITTTSPVYSFQYSTDAGKTWKFVDDGKKITKDSLMKMTLGRDKPFIGEVKYRVIVGQTEDVVNTVIDKAATGVFPSVDCDFVYAIDSSLVIVFRPMGEGKGYSGCLDETIAIEGEKSGRPEVFWLDSNKNPMIVGDSIVSMDETIKEKIKFKIGKGILGAKKMTDTLYLVGLENTGCADTQKITVKKYADVEFRVRPKSQYCEFGAKVVPTVTSPTSGIEFKWETFELGSTNVLETQRTEDYEVKKQSPEIFDYKVAVRGKANKYCPVTDTIKFSVYKKFSLDLDLNSKTGDVAVCLPTDGSASTVTLTAKKVFTEAVPSYDKELTTTYIWYREADGTKTKLAETTDPHYDDKVSDNNNYKYSVEAKEGVCHIDNETAGFELAKSDNPSAEIRKPVDFTLTANKEKMCVGEDITFEIEFKDRITSDVKVQWKDNGELKNTSTTTIATTDNKESFTFTPENETKGKVAHTMVLTTVDGVCSDTKIEKEVGYTVYVPVKIELLSDAALGPGNRLQKCIDVDPEDDTKYDNNIVKLWTKTLAGNPNEYKWGNEALKADSTYNLALKQGANSITVDAYDGVCDKSGDAANINKDKKDTLEIFGASKIELSLSADKKEVCANDAVEFKMGVKYSLDDNIKVDWKENGTAISGSAPSAPTNGTNVTLQYVPKNSGDRKITSTMVVTATDEVCVDNQPKAEVSYDVLVPLKIHVTSTAVDEWNRHQHCISDKGDNIVEVTVMIDQGNPKEYLWSDGRREGHVEGSTTGPTHKFVVTPGVATFSVEAYDKVCNVEKTGVKAEAYDEVTVVSAEPIKITLSKSLENVCEEENEVFTVKVENALYPETQKVEWFESGDAVGTTMASRDTLTYKVTNSEKRKVSKTMMVQTWDSICPQPKGEYKKAEVAYKIWKNIKFDLSSNLGNDQICLAKGVKGQVTLTTTATQGDPTKIVWTYNGEDIQTKVADNVYVSSNSFDIGVGSHKFVVTAYDDVCSRDGVAAGSPFGGEAEDITIEAREKIEIDLKLVDGRPVVCAGEQVKLVSNVNNSMPGAKSYLTWKFSPNEYASVSPEGNASYVANGSYSTGHFAPVLGSTTVTVTAQENEDASKLICPAVSADYTVSAQTITKIALSADNYAVCQDTSNGGSNEVEVVITARVLQGVPDSVVWMIDGKKVDESPVRDGKSSITIVPTKDVKYTAYGSDDICRVAVEAAMDSTITVTHKVDLLLSVETEEVQLWDSTRLHVKPSIKYGGDYTWRMTEPEAKKLGKTNGRHFAEYAKEKGEFSFTVETDNGNCGRVTSNEVTVNVADYNVIPNVITPYNGNPKNDRFMDGYDVQIFDRYQQVIYSGSDGWDATYRGQTVTPGTYFYIVTKKDGRTIKGTVEVYK